MGIIKDFLGLDMDEILRTRSFLNSEKERIDTAMSKETNTFL